MAAAPSSTLQPGSGIGPVRRKKIKFIDHRPSGGKYWRLPLNLEEHPEQLSIAWGCAKKYAKQVVAGGSWPRSVGNWIVEAPNPSLEAIAPPTNGTVLKRGMRPPPKACKYAGTPYETSNRTRPKTTDERHHGGYGYVNLTALEWALEVFGLPRKAAAAVARKAFCAAFDWSIEYAMRPKTLMERVKDLQTERAELYRSIGKSKELRERVNRVEKELANAMEEVEVLQTERAELCRNIADVYETMSQTIAGSAGSKDLQAKSKELRERVDRIDQELAKADCIYLKPLEHEKNNGTLAWHYCALSFFTTPTVKHVLEDAGVTGGVVWDWAGHCDSTMMLVYVGY